MTRGRPRPGPLAQPQNARAQALNVARRQFAANQFAEARRTLEPLARGGRDPQALLLLAICAEKLEEPAEAIRLAKKSLAIQEHPSPLQLLARVTRARGDTDDCLRYCDRGLQLRPGDQQFLFLQAGALEEAGRHDEAAAIVEPVVRAAGPDSLPPVPAQDIWCKILLQRKAHDEAIAQIDRQLARPDLPDEWRQPTLTLRAKAHDRAGQYDAAFEAARAANELRGAAFDPEAYTRHIAAFIRTWSPDALAAFPRSECDSEIPVFIAGMPRSGTSLLDQIIDAHPQAAGVGELETIERFSGQLAREHFPGKVYGRSDQQKWTRTAKKYVSEVTKLAPAGTRRIVNKALGNDKLVGLLALLFPRTRIIHVVRDPRDVAVSCFLGGFNAVVHPWTTRLEWAAVAWAQSQRLMDHWKAVLDVPILEVRYERLVSEPEREFPRVIEFLGLEWDDRCFDFYKSRRTVRTLSYDQVNKPLYTSSVGRHRNYAKHLEGIDFPPYDPD